MIHKNYLILTGGKQNTLKSLMTTIPAHVGSYLWLEFQMSELTWCSEGSVCVRVWWTEDVAQTELHPLQTSDAWATVGCLPAPVLFFNKTEQWTTKDTFATSRCFFVQPSFWRGKSEVGPCILWQLSVCRGGSCLLLKQANAQWKDNIYPR